jgi:periodic tryptophan protein 1
MISTCSFLPRGVMREDPLQYELHSDEIEQLIQRQAGLSLDEANNIANKTQQTHTTNKTRHNDNKDNTSDNETKEEGEEEEEEEEEVMHDQEIATDSSDSSDEDLVTPGKANATEEELLAELGMNEYDDEPEGAELFLAGKSLSVFEDNTEDPYITLADGADEESDEEDQIIHPTDAVIVCGRSEAQREDSGEPQSTIEIHIYDDEKGSLFVHHDFPIPSFPLTTQWINTDPRAKADKEAKDSKGSFLAIGQMSAEAGIEIWNLDVLDVLEPVAILGGVDADAQNTATNKKSSKNKKSKGPVYRAGSHTDSVLSLSWHEKYSTRLASGSADKTIKLWDITTQQCSSTFTNLHSAPVQSLQFNLFEPQVMLSGGYDRVINLIDVRTGQVGRKWKLNGEVEQIKWNPFDGNLFLVSTSDGLVQLFNCSNDKDKPLFTLNGHSGECTAISWNSKLPQIFASGGVDGVVKVWNCSTNNSTVEPVLVGAKDLKVGKIMSMSYDTENPWLIVAGGDKDKLALWHTAETKQIQSTINQQLTNSNQTKLISADRANNTKEAKESKSLENDSAGEQAAEANLAKKKKKANKKSKDQQ